MSTGNISDRDIKALKRWGDYQNNTNVSLVNRYIYFAVDKVANSSIKKFLFEKEYQPVNKAILSLYDPRCSPLLSPFQLPMSPKQLLVESDLYKFAFVRNPYTRLLSCYLDRIRTFTSRPSREFRRGLGKSSFGFSDFIEFVCDQPPQEQNSHWRIQTADILFELVQFDFVGRFEDLEQDLGVISSHVFGVPLEEDALAQNSSPKKTAADEKVSEYYDQKLLDLVHEAYRADFDHFGYERIIL